MSGLEFSEIMYSGWELLAFMLVTMLRILHELRDLKAGDLQGSRRMAPQIRDEQTTSMKRARPGFVRPEDVASVFAGPKPTMA